MKVALRMVSLWTDPLKTARLIIFTLGLSTSNALAVIDRYDLTFEYGATSYDLETSKPSYWSVEGKCAPFVEREFKI